MLFRSGRELLRRDAKEMPQNGRNAGRSQAIMALKKVIDQVVGSKISEGQFDEVDFTLRDLTRIKESILSVLLSMYHTRMVRSPDRRREKGGRGRRSACPCRERCCGGSGRSRRSRKRRSGDPMSAETFRSLGLVSGRMLCYVILYILSLSTAGGGWGRIDGGQTLGGFTF